MNVCYGFVVKKSVSALSLRPRRVFAISAVKSFCPSQQHAKKIAKTNYRWNTLTRDARSAS